VKNLKGTRSIYASLTNSTKNPLVIPLRNGHMSNRTDTNTVVSSHMLGML